MELNGVDKCPIRMRQYVVTGGMGVTEDELVIQLKKEMDGMTVAQVATKMQVSKSYLYKMLEGTRQLRGMKAQVGLARLSPAMAAAVENFRKHVA